LEHFISERFEERIDAKLGRPRFDPHGHCIPALDGRMAKQVSTPLTEVEGNGHFVVDSVADQDAALLRRLKAHGIVPGEHLQVMRSSQEEFVLRTANAKTLRLPRPLAAAVRIRSTE
jgi:DtxR family Mn-dependent transcriptional regulator